MEVDGVSNELRRRFGAVLDFGQIDWSDFGTGVVILALWVSGSVIRLNITEAALTRLLSVLLPHFPQ